MPETPAKRKRSGSREIDEAENYEEIPTEFFCPISKKFMSDPVRIRSLGLTFNRDSVKGLYRPEDVLPDLRRREIMKNWLSQYYLEAAYNFISNEDELVAATKFVMEQGSEDILRQFASVIKYKSSLLNSGAIGCVATLLSRPCPPDSWVVATLSILAYHSVQGRGFLVPEGIHPQYSLLGSISAALNSEDEEFQTGLIKLIYTLVAKSPDLSLMPPKLLPILQTLISYLWPIRGHLIIYNARMLLTLLLLAANRECCECLFDAGLIEMAFTLLDFGVSTPEEINSDPEKLSASRQLGSFYYSVRVLMISTCTKLLETLCDQSERARSRIQHMDEDEIIVLARVIAQARMPTYTAAINVIFHHNSR